MTVQSWRKKKKCLVCGAIFSIFSHISIFIFFIADISILDRQKILALYIYFFSVRGAIFYDSGSETSEMLWVKNDYPLNLLDDYVREPNENPSVGIILCTERDYFEVEYTLRGLDKPVGVSEYLLTKELPPELKNKLPDAKQLENEIRKEIKTGKSMDKSE